VADPRLLDTYDDERRAIGELTVEQAYTRYVTRVAPYLGTEGMQALVDDFSIEIGCRCNSAAVVLEPGDDEALHEHPRESKGRPGSRAPHVLVPRDGARVSTLDLFGNGFVLLAGADGAAWHEAALSAAGQFGVPLDGYVIADAASGFADAYGISQAGAVLVRPDGVVAWRAVGAESEPQRVVRRALASVLCKED
jgi:hypothetical protein